MGERDAGRRQLGGDAERLEPQSRQDHAGVEQRMTGPEVKRCIYPGCERPAVPPHPLGGPQPSFCDLEEHNASPRTRSGRAWRRWRRTNRRLTMADEAYRAVFLSDRPDRQDGPEPDD